MTTTHYAAAEHKPWTLGTWFRNAYPRTAGVRTGRRLFARSKTWTTTTRLTGGWARPTDVDTVTRTGDTARLGVASHMETR